MKKVTRLFAVVGLLALAVACTPGSQPQPTITTVAPTQIEVTPSTQTVVTRAAATPRPTAVTRPTLTSSATAEVFSCPLPGSASLDALPALRLLYVNENTVWLWDESSGKKEAVALPTSAASPHLSPDGRYIAFFEQGQVVSPAANPLEEIWLFVFDRQENQIMKIGGFTTRAAHEKFPQSQRVYLAITWIPSETDMRVIDRMQVEVTAEPWAIDFGADYSSERYLVTLPRGALQRIDRPLSPEFDNPWDSPDRRFSLVEHPEGLQLVDRLTGAEQTIPLEPACPSQEICYLTGTRAVFWHPSEPFFYTLSARNAYFDERAETAVYRVQVVPEIRVEILIALHASPATFSFSPDRRYLSFWNQPDVDNAPARTLNWVSLGILDMEKGEIRHYADGWVLRLSAWNADSQRFVFTYSPSGGPNPVVKRAAVGDVCRPPFELTVPANQMVMKTTWLDRERLVIYTVPANGIPNRYTLGMYFYNLREGVEPQWVDDIIQDYDQLYGTRTELVVLEQGSLP